MTNLQIFSNDNFSVRTINENGEIWFVAKDVAGALGYSENSLNQTNNLFGHVPEIWKSHKQIMGRSENGVEQRREALCLSEQGLYFFLGRSDKRAALPYQIWIAGEVVPSLRKTGNYNIQGLDALNIRAAELLKDTAQYASKDEQKIIIREAFKLATGHDMPEPETKKKKCESTFDFTTKRRQAFKHDPEKTDYRNSRERRANPIDYEFTDWYFGKDD